MRVTRVPREFTEILFQNFRIVANNKEPKWSWGNTDSCDSFLPLVKQIEYSKTEDGCTEHITLTLGDKTLLRFIYRYRFKQLIFQRFIDREWKESNL